MVDTSRHNARRIGEMYSIMNRPFKAEMKLCSNITRWGKDERKRRRQVQTSHTGHAIGYLSLYTPLLTILFNIGDDDESIFITPHAPLH